MGKEQMSLVGIFILKQCRGKKMDAIFADDVFKLIVSK